MLQREDGESDVYLASPEHPTPRPIRGPERTQGMFGTDFSYEDLERVQHGWRPGAAEIVAPENGERPTRVRGRGPVARLPLGADRVLARPGELPAAPHSLLRAGRKLPRKELTVDPHSHVKHGELWVVHSAIMRDREGDTTTHMMVDSHAQEALLPDGQFTVQHPGPGVVRVIRADFYLCKSINEKW